VDRGREILDRRSERIGFHREQNRVVRPVDGAYGCDLRRQGYIAMRADDLQPALLELRRAPRPHQKGHFPTGLG
jgi:hypothetical protein